MLCYNSLKIVCLFANLSPFITHWFIICGNYMSKTWYNAWKVCTQLSKVHFFQTIIMKIVTGSGMEMISLNIVCELNMPTFALFLTQNKMCIVIADWVKSRFSLHNRYHLWVFKFIPWQESRFASFPANKSMLMQCCHLISAKWQHCSNIAIRWLVCWVIPCELRLTYCTKHNSMTFNFVYN